MDAIGNITAPIVVRQPAVTSAQPSSTQVAEISNAPQLPAPVSTTNDEPAVPSTTDLHVAAERRRLEAVQKAAQEIANTFVVSDKTFTIFKDITGQYITRFTSLRDGKVTYIPEPELLRPSSNSAPDVPLLDISA